MVSVTLPIWLSLMRNGVGDAFVDATGKARGVGDEEVVADELDALCGWSY